MFSEDDRLLHTQAFEYFKIVAAQRLTVINFYIAIATLLLGCQLALIQKDNNSNVIIGFGVLLVFLSFVFWK